jgi:hypothetical protein
MTNLRKIAALIMFMAINSSVNTYAVASGSFYLESYKKEVATMLDYIARWDGSVETDQDIKVVAWMKNRVKNQDIPAARLMEITQLLSDSTKNNDDKINGMWNIIQKNKEARIKVKRARAKAKTKMQNDKIKWDADNKKQIAEWEKARFIRLAKEAAIVATTMCAIVVPAITIGETILRTLTINYINSWNKA